jgi:hypothetical protein
MPSSSLISINADLYLFNSVILNVLQVINHTLTHLLKVTIELRRQTKSMSLGSDAKPRISMYFDVGLSICLLISVAIGGSARDSRWYRHRGAWRVGYAFGFVVVGLQLLLALPQLANKRLILSAKLSDLKEERYTPDNKLPSPSPSMVAATDVERTSARRREEPVQTGEDLV